MDDQRHARHLLPQRRFLVTVQVAEMETVIRDNDENRVLGMWRGLQRIPHPAEMIVAMAQCGIIVAYALLPPLFLRGVDILQENLVRVSIGVDRHSPSGLPLDFKIA